MAWIRILACLIVFISFANSLPAGNITHTPRRVFKFPQNASTAVRRHQPERVVMLSPYFYPEYLLPRMMLPATPLVVRPNVNPVVSPQFTQVIGSQYPQIVKLQAPQVVKFQAPQVVKSEVQKKLPEVAKTPEQVRLLQPAHQDQLISASSYSTTRTPSGGWARDKNNTKRIGTGEEQFVFPEDDDDKELPPPPPKVINRAKFKPTVKNQAPACADGSTFCERVDGYPANILESILDNDLDQFKELQGTDELKSPPITQRIDANTTSEQPLCLSIEEVVFPKTAKNKDDKWLFVVNTGSFVQGVRIEKCLNTSDEPEQSCFFNDSFPNGYKTICKQKYIYRRMVAVDEEGKPVKDVFLLPSCCSCTVVSVGAMFRQGVMRKALQTTVTPTPKH